MKVLQRNEIFNGRRM